MAQFYKVDTRVWYLENLIKAGIRFSTTHINQVEGYLLPDASNNIKLAVCYINVDMNSAALESYINECFFRALGLTGVSDYKDGILSVRKEGELTTVNQKDLELLSVLYDSQVVSGDDKYSIINKLSN